MADLAAPDEKRMRLRYSGTCCVCRAELPARAEAIYVRSTKAVRCLTCPSSTGTAVEPTASEPVAIDSGAPGAWARREFERRRSKREQDIRSRHPRLGGMMLALSDDPQSTKAWDQGAIGEEQLGARLTEQSSPTWRVLHDRRMPRSTANIDHLVVTPSGVWVIDAKRYRGRPELRVEGGLIRPRVEKLIVAGRDRTQLVAGVHKQVAAVRDVLGGEAPVHGVLCFIDADWPLVGGAFSIDSVAVLWPRKLYARLSADGDATVDDVDRWHRALAAALRPS